MSGYEKIQVDRKPHASACQGFTCISRPCANTRAKSYASALIVWLLCPFILKHAMPVQMSIFTSGGLVEAMTGLKLFNGRLHVVPIRNNVRFYPIQNGPKVSAA